MMTDFKFTTIDCVEASYLPLMGNGVPASFCGANGFPLGSYKRFIAELSTGFELECLSLRACWPYIAAPPKQVNWEIYAKDLIAFLDQRNRGPVVGIGHSQGAAATLIAATKRPDLFSSIVLIEPASVSKFWNRFLKVAPVAFKKTRQPMKSAIQKQDKWESKEAFLNHCKQSPPLRRIPEEVLNDFVEAGLKKSKSDGYELVFPKAWEAANYAWPIFAPDYLEKVKLPVYVIAGKPSLFFDQKARDLWVNSFPNVELQVNEEYGHLIPLEAPEVCAEYILNKYAYTEGLV